MSQREALFSYAILNHLPHSTPHVLLLTSPSLLALQLLPFLPPHPQVSCLLTSLPEQLSLSLWWLPVVSGNSSHAQGCVWNDSIPVLMFFLQHSSHEGPSADSQYSSGWPSQGLLCSQSYVNGHLSGNPFAVATPPFRRVHTCGVLRWIPPSVICQQTAAPGSDFKKVLIIENQNDLKLSWFHCTTNHFPKSRVCAKYFPAAQ